MNRESFPPTNDLTFTVIDHLSGQITNKIANTLQGDHKHNVGLISMIQRYFVIL